MAHEIKLKLNDLLVNTENYRFEPVASQKEALNLMIENQKEKLYNLAKHIIENGFNPNDKIQVIQSNHEPSKYLVLEGNRRVVSLKLLAHPDLIEDSQFISLKRKFKKLSEEHKKSPILKNILCTLYDNVEEANKWIKLKHVSQSNGIGTVHWTGQQTHSYEEKVEGKSSIALQVMKLLKNAPTVGADIKDNIAKLRLTNLNRLIGDPEVRQFLGLEINKGVLESSVEKGEVLKGLKKVAKDLVDPDFSVKNIYTKDDRRDYIKTFKKAEVPNIKKLAEEPWQVASAVESPDTPGKRPKPNPKLRKVLIPKSCNLKIGIPRINAIYWELQRLDVYNYVNAVGVLYRVFVELSIDSYLEHHKLTSSPSSAKSGTDFQQKVFQVINHLESKKMADAGICKGIRVSIKNANDLLGLDTWHAYVHNNRFSPIPQNLVLTWDSMQDFMIILWDNII